MYDVIVVGAGPAGSATAKKCAEQGLETLLLEKRGLPRDKICSGMIMGPLAHTLIKSEFGDIPEAVFANPPKLSGYRLHVPGIGSELVENLTLLTWRRDLDHWMSQKAQTSGAELWQRSGVVRITGQKESFKVVVEKDKKRQDLEAKFVVGADGATSVVRTFLYPELQVKYGQVLQEHYRGTSDLDSSTMHWFYPIEHSPASFTVHQKDGFIVLDAAGKPGQSANLMGSAKEYLARDHHLDTDPEPVWKGVCLEPALYRELTSRTFKPAGGNALLVGDAAGFLMPVSGEGIGLGIKSALLAAGAIADALEHGKPADEFYLSGIEPIISLLGEIYPLFRRIMEEARGGGQALPKLLKEAYQSTLRPL